MLARYVALQEKRFLRRLPGILLTSLALLACVGFFALLTLENRAKSGKFVKAEIGIVGDMEGSYLGMGLDMLEELDSSRYSIHFRYYTEEEAKEAIEKGEITVYLRVPENFIDGVINGENPPIEVVGNGTLGMGSIVMNEITWSVSTMLTESERAVYATQDLAYCLGAKNAYSEVADRFYLTLIGKIFAREDTIAVHELGVGAFGGIVEYYACGVCVFLLLLWGIACVPFFSSDKNKKSAILTSKGLSAPWQILGEYLAFLLFTTILLFLFVCVLAAALPFIAEKIPFVASFSSGKLLGFFLKSLPMLWMILAMQQAVFECTGNLISQVLAQFLLALGLGYGCGCLYPITFFPKTWQAISAYLPAGVCMKAGQTLLLGRSDVREYAWVLLYAFAFFALSVIVRERRHAS